jgi:hypothetical protein
MRVALVLIAMTFLGGSLAHTALVGAAVVVLENQTADKIDFMVQEPDSKPTRHKLVAGDVAPIPVAGPVGIAFDVDGRQHRYLLRANSIYCFVGDKKFDLSEFTLPILQDARPAKAKSADGGALLGSSAHSDAVCTVPVSILVDDQEPTVRAIWEKRLRNRLAAASDIFERYCRVRFQVTSVSTWISDKRVHDFNRSVAEFERKTRPQPGHIAIGFTGRYEWAPGESHIGGIRGPFRSHVLIRESLIRVSEPERLEVLVHELGHYLGAAHSAEENSVMRPKLGDRRACARSFRIGFDAQNTLAMYLVAEELRRHQIHELNEAAPETKAALRRVYVSLAKALPEDPAAPKYLMLLE